LTGGYIVLKIIETDYRLKKLTILLMKEEFVRINGWGVFAIILSKLPFLSELYNFLRT